MNIDLSGMVTMIIVFLVLAFGIGGCSVWLFTTSDSYESKEKLEPVRYELVIDNNEVDTLWVYEL